MAIFSEPDAGIEIAVATQSDLVGIHEIYNYEVVNSTSSFDYVPRNTADQLTWWLAVDRSKYPVVVAKREGRVVGWAAIHPFGSRPGYALTVEDSVYIHHLCRGQRIGSRLLAKVIDMSRQLGHKFMIAKINSDSEPSISLHKLHGFRKVGTLPKVGYKFDSFIDVDMYWKEI